MMITLLHTAIGNRFFQRLALLTLFLATVSFTSAQDIIHPTTGTNTVSIDQATTRNYYDSGGAGCNLSVSGLPGSYSSGESGVTVLCPTDPGIKVTLEFLEVDVETRSGGNGCFDVLYIYNGDSPSAPLLFQGCGEDGFQSCPGGEPGDGDDCLGIEGGPCDLDGTNAPNPNNNIFSSSAPDGCITVRFTTDGSVQEGGWIAEVSAAPRPLALTCPPNQTVITDLQTCTFTVGSEQDAVFSGPVSATLTNDYNNTSSLVGEVLTSGQVATVTFTATDGTDPANDLMCTVVITVEEPFFTCLRDTTLILDQNNLATLPNPFVIPSRQISDTLFSNGQVDGSGMIQNYTLPAGVTDITLEAAGGNGGAGGRGARLMADFTLNNPNLVILVAAAGASSSLGSGSGGGGTFIASGSGDFSGVDNADVLLIAGGGSGATVGGFTTDFFGQDSDQFSNTPDGSAGFGGGQEGGGGASLRNERNTSLGGGFAIVNGGAGGSGSGSGGAAGGYGGGGQENSGGGGGGGGARGGDGGTSGEGESARAAEPGTSYSAGANTSAITPNPRLDGDGFVVISYTIPAETLTLSQSTFTCADAGQPVQVTATRAGTNCTASCTITITLVDPNNTCSAVSGNIVWEHNRFANPVGVENATVTLSGDTDNTDLTDANGDYRVAGGGNLTVTPVKTNDFYEGVTAADVTRIQQHVTFANRFDDGYKVIAADVNRTNSVTSLDASVIFHSLNGNPDAQSIFQTASWRFVDATYNFINENAPWLPSAFPEVINLMNVTADVAGQDFVGVKMGDVNGSWGVAVPLNRPAMELRTDDQVLVAGQRIRVPFRTNGLPDVAAWQFALRFDTDYLQFTEAIPSTAFPLDKENFGTWQADRGELRSVFAVPQGQGLPKGAVIFALDFQVKRSGLRLSEVLRLAEEVLPGAVYDTQLRGGELVLSFYSSGSLPSIGIQEEAALGFVLEQNTPNPFGGETLIRFELPEAGETNFLVHDLQGRLLYEERGYLDAGQHFIRLDAGRLATTGVVTYTLRSGTHSATRRMVLVR